MRTPRFPLLLSIALHLSPLFFFFFFHEPRTEKKKTPPLVVSTIQLSKPPSPKKEESPPLLPPSPPSPAAPPEKEVVDLLPEVEAITLEVEEEVITPEVTVKATVTFPEVSPPPKPYPKRATNLKKTKPTRPSKPRRAVPKKTASSPPAPPPPIAKVEKAEKERDKKRDELLQKAKKAFSKASDTHSESIIASNEIALPQKIDSLHSEKISFSEDTSCKTVGERSYRDELRRRLQLSLILPEPGLVEIKLTLDRGGKCKRVEIVKAKSQENRKAVEKAIKTLYFPPFGPHFPGEESHLFNITLTSG